MKIKPFGLMVAAMVIAPFTLLRFGFFGVAELLVLVVFLGQVTKGLKRSLFRDFVLTKFWLLYLTASIFGIAVNQFVVDNRTGTMKQAGFDLAAYLFILVTCFSLERLVTHSNFDAPRFVRNVFVCSVITFGILYLASFFTPTLFGLPLKYYDYFVPWAENLHQVSMTLVPLPFLGLAVVANSAGVIRKLLLLGLAVLAGVMAVSTGSSKALLAMYIGVFVYAYSYALFRLGKGRFVQVNLVFGVIGLLILTSADWIRVGDLLFEENDVGGVRNFLYGHALDLGLQSPFVGRGPGSHVEFQGAFMDAHQTFLTAFLQAGFVGVAAFVALICYIARRVLYSPPLLAAFSTLVVYAAGGDILRRLPAWIVLFAILHYSERRAAGRKDANLPREQMDNIKMVRDSRRP